MATGRQSCRTSRSSSVRAVARCAFNIADFLRFRDGRLVEFREFMNTFDVVQQALNRLLPI
jgi:ketosteroid isomerase-like protein